MAYTQGAIPQKQVPKTESWRHILHTMQTPAQTRFENILLATDFSPATGPALPYAVEIARRSGGTIHAVHVVSPDIYPLAPPEEWSKLAQEEKAFRSQKQLELEQELQGLAHEFIFPRGDVWECLSRIIEEKKIDLLILGTHGRTAVEKTFLGSVAEKIFRQAGCPVLTVGPHVTAKATHAHAAELNCILYATDFSSESFAAVRHAIYLAKEHHAKLVLVHAMDRAEPGQVNTAFETLRDVVPLGAGLASKPICIVERGKPANAILAVAEEHNADLIVFGVRSAEQHVTAVSHLTRSVAYKVVTQATCPVLTVRN